MRLKKLIEEVKADEECEMVIGGVVNEKERYISPTVVVNPKTESGLMKEEIFGPILPVISYVDFEEVIHKHINQREKPLAIYYIGSTSSSNYKDLLEKTSSGCLSANEIMG
jgi:aldehyde dehydrogenase (NAD+)